MADIKELTVGGTTYKIKDEVCRTNIWSVQNKVGKNLLNFKAWSEAVPVNKGTKTVSDNAITLTATDNDCYTKYGASEYPQDVRIKVNPGDVLTLSWDYSVGSSQSDDKVYIFGYNETEPPLSNANVSSQTGYLQYTVPANAKFCTFRLGVTTSGNTATYSNIMICDKAVYDQDSSFQPYGAPNYDLTRMMTPFFTVPINHNMIYRGANLGDTLTADQDTALSSGNFTDLYLGDYWTKQITIPAFYEVTTAEPADWSTNYTSYYTKSGDTYTPVSGDTAPTWAANTYYERLVPAQTVTLKAVIADFDTFYAGYASGSAAINTHHAAVIVTGFSNVVWNKTNSTAGGYVASLIHKWLVGSALPQIETWFGSAKVLSHQKLLTNAITGDAASGWAWSSQKIALLSENQMYGSKVWGGSKATNGGYEPGEAFKHLNVFNHIDANLLFGNKNIWLRDIASAVGAAGLSNGGYARNYDASATWIAPAALILLS